MQIGGEFATQMLTTDCMKCPEAWISSYPDWVAVRWDEPLTHSSHGPFGNQYGLLLFMCNKRYIQVCIIGILMVLQPSFFNHVCTGDTCRANENGPRTNPCGTPNIHGNAAEVELSNLINCDLNHRGMIQSNWEQDQIYRKCIEDAVIGYCVPDASNAADMSIVTGNVNFLASIPL